MDTQLCSRQQRGCSIDASALLPSLRSPARPAPDGVCMIRTSKAVPVQNTSILLLIPGINMVSAAHTRALEFVRAAHCSPP